MNVNYDNDVFRKISKVGVGRIARETIEFILSFKNIYIQYVKRFRYKMANCLASLFVFQPVCIVGWGFVPTKFFLSQ